MPNVAISAEEIAKVKAEWEEKEKKRKEKAKEKEEKEKAKEKEEKEKEKEKEKDSDNKTGDKEKEGSKSPKIPAASSTPPPAHERYTLHRNFFSSKYKEPRAVHKMELTFLYQCVKMNTDDEGKLRKPKNLRLGFLPRLEERLRSIRQICYQY